LFLAVICIVHYAVRNILFSLTLLLACFSWQEGAAAAARPIAEQSTAEQGELASAIDGELYKSPGHLSAGEQVRGLQPVPSLKQDSNGLRALSSALEHQFEQQATAYLKRSGQICLSFSSCDIIFPFHYFW
jgi:hypothetical protein